MGDESSMEEHMQGRGIKEEYDDMDEDEKADQEWEDPLSDKRSSRMSGIVKTNTNEDQSMFNGGHFDM